MSKTYLPTGNYPATAAVNTNAPWDTRQNVDAKTDLIAWNDEKNESATFGKYIYKGMPVIVDGSELYILSDTSKIKNSDYSGWIKVGGGNIVSSDYAQYSYVRTAIIAFLDAISSDTRFEMSAPLLVDGVEYYGWEHLDTGTFYYSKMNDTKIGSDLYDYEDGSMKEIGYAIKEFDYKNIANEVIKNLPTNYARQGAVAKTLDDIRIDTTELAKDNDIQTLLRRIGEFGSGDHNISEFIDYYLPSIQQKLSSDDDSLLLEIGHRGEGGQNVHQKLSDLATICNDIKTAVMLTAAQADEDWQNVQPITE